MKSSTNRIVDSTFIITVLGKGIGGFVEALSAFTLVFFSVEQLQMALHYFGRLGADMSHEITSGSRLFVILYFGLRGLLRLGLAISLLNELLWAYPAAIVFLTGSVVYQIYLMLTGHYSVGLLSLTLFDLVVIGLTYVEWRKLKAGGHLAKPHLTRAAN